MLIAISPAISMPSISNTSTTIVATSFAQEPLLQSALLACTARMFSAGELLMALFESEGLDTSETQRGLEYSR